MAQRIMYSPTVRVNSPAWAKDYGDREHLLPGGGRVDPAQFPREGSVTATVNNAAGAAVNATTIDVDALSGPIPAGVVLRSATGKIVGVTTAAATGAVALAVDPLTEALVDNEAIYFIGNGKITVLDGTLLGRSDAERDANSPFGPAADADTEMYLLYHTIADAEANPDATLYRWGSLVAINHLRGYAGLSSAKKTFLAAKYQLTRGAD